jgi:hypothetical protein
VNDCQVCYHYYPFHSSVEAAAAWARSAAAAAVAELETVIVKRM